MAQSRLSPTLHQALHRGLVIPAHPLALDARRQLDVRRQRALTRYYLDAGAGGLAVGVHTTQFAIRDPSFGLLRPVLSLAMDTLRSWPTTDGREVLRIAGVCGPTAQAVREAELAAELGYHAALLSLAALPTARESELVSHCREIGRILPILGFYLQPAVGGRLLPAAFWRQFVEIEAVVAIKIAPFNRYQTLDVLRAVWESGRGQDIALYTGNDDHILLDLLTVHQFDEHHGERKLRMVGGLLGQWAVWTQAAVNLCRDVADLVEAGRPVPQRWLTLAAELTDANAALFDAAHGFRGCIPGIHEVLRRQGLLAGTWCLDPHENLSPGQSEEIDRVTRAYPHLTDDAFVRDNLDRWLKE